MDAFHYQETTFSKSDYTTYIKGYVKKLKEHLEKNNPDRVQPFMKGAQEMVKFIVSNFDEFSFYTPESYDMDNSIILSYFKEGEDTPTFLYFMDGLKAIAF
jgi:NAD(P)H-flavin reductase